MPVEPRREISRRRLHDDVADYLLTDIRDGVYSVGQVLPSERAMMQEFSVGRPAVREALSKLQRMGLVDIRAGMRARVCKPSVSALLGEMGGVVSLLLATPTGQQEFQWLRRLFESALARHAARAATEAQLSALRDLVERQRAVVEDADAFAALDMDFHRSLAAVAGQELVLALHKTLAQWLLEQRMVTLRTPRQSHVALAAHEHILNALTAHDADAAETAMAAHLDQVQRVFQVQA